MVQLKIVIQWRNQRCCTRWPSFSMATDSNRVHVGCSSEITSKLWQIWWGNVTAAIKYDGIVIIIVIVIVIVLVFVFVIIIKNNNCNWPIYIALFAPNSPKAALHVSTRPTWTFDWLACLHLNLDPSEGQGRDRAHFDSWELWNWGKALLLPSNKTKTFVLRE